MTLQLLKKVTNVLTYILIFSDTSLFKNISLWGGRNSTIWSHNDVTVPIMLCLDVGNDENIILCYFGGRIMSVFEVIGAGAGDLPPHPPPPPPPPPPPQEAQQKKTGLNRVKGPLKMSEKALYSFPQLQGSKITFSKQVSKKKSLNKRSIHASCFLSKLKLVGIHCATQEMILSWFWYNGLKHRPWANYVTKLNYLVVFSLNFIGNLTTSDMTCPMAGGQFLFSISVN